MLPLRGLMLYKKCSFVHLDFVVSNTYSVLEESYRCIRLDGEKLELETRVWGPSMPMKTIKKLGLILQINEFFLLNVGLIHQFGPQFITEISFSS